MIGGVCVNSPILKRQQTAPLSKHMQTENNDYKLSHLVWSKRHFNPHSKADLLQYKHFLEKNKWPKNCPFILEWPYLTIQEMIRSRLIEAHFDKILESVDDKL